MNVEMRKGGEKKGAFPAEARSEAIVQNKLGFEVNTNSGRTNRKCLKIFREKMNKLIKSRDI